MIKVTMEILTEGVKQIGRILQAIVGMLSGQPTFLFGIASMLLAIVGFIAIAFVPINPLLTWFPFALLFFGLILVILSFVLSPSISGLSIVDAEIYQEPNLSLFMKAKKAWLVGAAQKRTIVKLKEKIKEKLRQGDEIYFLLVNPESSAVEIAGQRSHPPKTRDEKQYEIQRSLEVLSDIYLSVGRDERSHLNVKTTQYSLGYGIQLLLPKEETQGIVYIKLYPYKVGFKPKFVFRPSDSDGDIFLTFKNEVKELWESAEAYQLNEEI